MKKTVLFAAILVLFLVTMNSCSKEKELHRMLTNHDLVGTWIVDTDIVSGNVYLTKDTYQFTNSNQLIYTKVNNTPSTAISLTLVTSDSIVEIGNNPSSISGFNILSENLTNLTLNIFTVNTQTNVTVYYDTIKLFKLN